MDNEVRINKYLSAAGFCSRREADRLIEAKRVKIDGVVATQGAKVMENQCVTVDDKEIVNESKPVLIALNKPVGIVCTTTDKQGKNNIVDFIDYPVRIYPIGRLDKDSRGLILLTNQGELSDKILRSVNGHENEYEVTVNKKVTDEFIKKMSGGVYLKELDRTTNKCLVERIGFKKFRIILKQGLNRQIRRMCEECGYEVTDLLRVRIMNITLDGIKEGEYRDLTDMEYSKLLEELGSGR